MERAEKATRVLTRVGQKLYVIFSPVRGWGHLALAVLATAVLVCFSASSRAEAQGIAISGTFYRHHFQLIAGESLTTPDIYVVVFNQGEESLKVRLSSVTPRGVQVILEETEFSIPPKGQHRLSVGVRATSQAVPGEYTISITADVQTEGTGIVITSAAQQQAKLTIFGEAGMVRLTTVTPLGEPFPAEIHLYQKLEGQLFPSGYSFTGELETRLVPGEYLIQGLYKGAEVILQDFSLKADEVKEILLVARTVFILGYSVVPNYVEDTGDIAFVDVVYTIRNIYEPLKRIDVILVVAFDDEVLEEAEILSEFTLDVGSMGGRYKYIPARRWQDGTYSFKMELYSQPTNTLITESRTVEIRLEETPTGFKVLPRSKLTLDPPGGTFTSTEGFFTIVAPAGVVLESTLIDVEIAASREIPPPPRGFSLGTSVANVRAVSAAGVSVEVLEKSVRVCLAYTDEEIEAAGGDMSRLFVGYFDPELEQWQIRDTEVMGAEKRVCTTTDHLSLWAVLTRAKGIPLWVLIVAIVGGLAAGTALVLIALRYRLIPRVWRLVRRYRLPAWVRRALARLPFGRLASGARKVRDWASARLRRVCSWPPLNRLLSGARKVWGWACALLRRVRSRLPLGRLISGVRKMRDRTSAAIRWIRRWTPSGHPIRSAARKTRDYGLRWLRRMRRRPPPDE